MSSEYKRRRGDRDEGRLLRSISGFDKFVHYIMPTRNDALNFFSSSIEVSNADNWLRSKRLAGYKGIGMLHIFIASYIRVVSKYPALNRFIAGRHIYARNDIEVVMIVKRTLDLESPEEPIKVHFSPAETIYDVYNKVNDAVAEIKNAQNTGTEDFADVLKKLPRPIMRLAVNFLKFCDYFGWCPKSWLDVSPFHGSIIFTDLGSLGIDPVYHHIYNFGTLSIFLAFGNKRREYVLNRKGELVQKKYINFRVTLDDRITDGFYCAAAFRYWQQLLLHPELLETPPESVKEDIE